MFSRYVPPESMSVPPIKHSLVAWVPFTGLGGPPSPVGCPPLMQAQLSLSDYRAKGEETGVQFDSLCEQGVKAITQQTER
eukprot:m.298292 g.298292  ORF g.298292 m.298292 type:complete len:80 (-) comp27217_c0_seq3:61-300(-)